MAVTDERSGMDEMLMSLRQLDANSVRIGLLSNPDEDPTGEQRLDADTLTRDADGNRTDKTVGEIGVLHELGWGVPRRSFIAATMDAKTLQIEQFMDETWDAVVDGRLDGQGAYDFIGAFVVDQMKETIDTQMGFKPLSQERLKQKTNSKGQTAWKALIWYGQLINSIRWKVEGGAN